MSDVLQNFLSQTGYEEKLPMKARMIAIIIMACLGLIGPLQATQARSISGDPSPIQEIDPYQDQVEDLSTFITAQMQSAKVPGLSIALIQDG